MEDTHLALLKQEMYRLISFGEGRELITTISTTKTVS